MPISSKHWPTQRTRSMSGTGSGQEEIFSPEAFDLAATNAALQRLR